LGGTRERGEAVKSSTTIHPELTEKKGNCERGFIWKGSSSRADNRQTRSSPNRFGVRVVVSPKFHPGISAGGEKTAGKSTAYCTPVGGEKPRGKKKHDEGRPVGLHKGAVRIKGDGGSRGA